ncbi:hypothetical protein EJ05DRAFT_481730 [Pseudovirgaria hyperparasitica]|uniref:DUF1308 domain-containing protein n=1 Tax=Pseudovirgaria hyperparasitica TaxID=470096 RepID=A0A6A6WL13_9PEZI|nr:uncharacterized protein EJ05DRAFT_481730 [Pseudovirgaria hyperparasitica]KAF2762853.1 hypothetical protein EJ05DRAFT_481730 [Pseudovirgaria hyperparasitica]
MVVKPSSESIKHAIGLLKQSGVDPDIISKQDLLEFAVRSPDAQQYALSQLLKRLELDESEDEEGDAEEQASTAAQDLLERCRNLLHELEQFASYLKEHKKDGLVEFRTFRNELKSEIRFLERLQKSDLGAEKIQHNISSSNFPYYETLWSAAKRSSEVLTFRKWFYWEPSSPDSNMSDSAGRQSHKTQSTPNKSREKHSALVDVVTQNGRGWIKVSTVNDNRILMELAKQGWRNDSDSDDDMDVDDTNTSNKADKPKDDDEDQVSLLKIATDLSRAAKSNRIHTHLPHITFVLPRVHRGAYAAVDAVLSRIVATGCTVQTADEIPTTPPLAATLHSLMIDESRSFSTTVNVDCTILLALVSDISHMVVEPQPWYPKAVTQQIAVERRAQLLPNTLYPVLAGRDLTCTTEAAQRMRQIVSTIGTDSEKARANIFVCDDAQNTKDNLIKRLANLTDHDVPPVLCLPIRVLPPFDLPATLSALPAVAAKVAEQLTDINQSIFLSAWANGITTLSSNATVAKQIERIIEELRGEDEETTGPHVWICSESRSLVSKAGRGDGKWGSAETRSVVRDIIC